MSIPGIDLAKFTRGNSEQRREFAAEPGKAYEDVGFVPVKNHGIPEDLINELNGYAKQFIGLHLPASGVIPVLVKSMPKEEMLQI